MRFFVLTLLIAFLAVFVAAATPQKAIIVSFPNETPDHVVIEAKEGLKAAVRLPVISLKGLKMLTLALGRRDYSRIS